MHATAELACFCKSPTFTITNMDTIFSLGEVQRSNYLRLLMRSFDSSYVCLWSFLPQPSNCFISLDGYYREEINQPAARSLFDEYRRGVLFPVNDRVPGLAFRINCPYIELNEVELQRRASTDVQRAFYQEAGIKIAVFMGCGSGEIELGWSNVPQNIENEMRTRFPEDFSRRSAQRKLPQLAVDPNRPSSSSSSLRSLSMDSPDSTSLFFNSPSTSHFQEASSLQSIPTPSASSALAQAIHSLQTMPSTYSSTSPLHQAIIQSFQQTMPSTNTNPNQQSMQAFTLTGTSQLIRETEHAAMTQAILTVLTSPSSSSFSNPNLPPSNTNLPYIYLPVNYRASAFKKYTHDPPALASSTSSRGSLRRQSMLKRAITYCRRINVAGRERILASRPTSTQLHHMINERRRREKINDSFQALRSLLPSDSATKKDKASVLTRTGEYLISLRGQVAELMKRNQQVEEQLLRSKEAATIQVASTSEASSSSLSTTERVSVRVTHVPETTMSIEQQIVDLRVILRGETPIPEVVIRILEFLKQVEHVNVMSVEASTDAVESTSFNRVILRLRIEGNEWDESAFQEAVKRVIADLAR